ncbi:hypothetical protein [Leptothermofonsia sp. ETS-13]|uniref:hypothetical protein n=1 Tax=Leptothermofonsia sp. ETS-13 TaxID=3035696 RepID=UPI003BA3C595
MQAPVPSCLLMETVDRIFASRRITRADQRLFLSLTTLTTEEKTLINQVFDRLHRGLLKVD